jgi:hypothetical protein
VTAAGNSVAGTNGPGCLKGQVLTCLATEVTVWSLVNGL